jgi:hypothetical protein
MRGGCSDAEAVLMRRQAKGRLWRSPSPANLSEYRRLEAWACWLRLQKQRASWEHFVDSLSVTTFTNATWAKIRSIQGKTLPYMPTPPLENFLQLDDFGKVPAFSRHWFPFLAHPPLPGRLRQLMHFCHNPHNWTLSLSLL